ncbi:TraB/GumN family protein [Paenibacillus albidus]|uniref:TraB/GumN family protein n=1 Tax=Paenibacillus albidus TaxID=2041023 RepID=UPI001BE6CD7F|nr:TraB/GumN family protein [Paenibacillus albidus]MBT2290030.1 TraB/GumN family protein [Paenibacillus albidus]
MKKLTALLLSFVMLFVFATGAQAQAAAPSVNIMLGEKQLTFDNGQPFFENATTLIPVKSFLEGLDYKLSWEAETSTLHASKGELSFALRRDNNQAMANDEAHQLTVAPKIVNGTLYAPLRFLAENAGYRVGWDAKNRAAALEQQDSKGFFWKVEKDGSVVYLLGSIHHGNDKMYPMRPEMNVAYANSDYLVVEANIAAPMDKQKIAEMQKKYMLYDDNTTLADHIDAKTYAKLQDILKENGAPETAYDPLKAWAAYLNLVSLKSALEGYGGGLGVDMYFLQKALATGKSILEMESHDFQYSMLNNFSDELTASLVKQTVEIFYQPDNSVETMADVWLAGDEAALMTELTGMKEIPEFYKAVVKDRNVGMIEKIEGYLGDENKETYFVIAGYFHMLGEDGIVTKLKEKGYTITRL